MKLNKKKKIITTFNRIAYSQQFFAGDWITRKAKINEHEIVSDLLSSEGNNKGKKALDVGCGVGGYFDILLEKGFKVVGFDIVEEMVKVGQSKFDENDNLEVMIADAEYMPFKSSSFHLVLGIDVLQYVDEESRRFMLQEMVKLVKPGNLIIVEVKNSSCPIFSLKRHREGTLAEFYSIASVTTILKNKGCAIEAIKGVFWPTFLSPIVVVKARKEVK
ncbi:class I SAM-dependent methyltransferase [candidate division WOR-3 bacterium]|nr:class I SAM-dependent methyltransferase [candidate division WOR-3 bacterium]